MKSKLFKRYCEDFPFLPALVNRTVGKHAKSRPRSEDVAFVATRPWESLNINDHSHYWPIGGKSETMYGRIRYHVIWKAERRGDSWYHQNGIYQEVEETENIAQRIQQLQVAFIKCWSGPEENAHIEAVVRIAWTGIYTFRSPIAIEIYRYPKQ